jgi:hypothetical protein
MCQSVRSGREAIAIVINTSDFYTRDFYTAISDFYISELYIRQQAAVRDYVGSQHGKPASTASAKPIGRRLERR